VITRASPRFRSRCAVAALASLLALSVSAAAGAAELSPDEVLLQAAGWGDLAEVNKQLRVGADANYEIKPGISVLTEAGRKGHVEIVRALLAAGADPNRGLSAGSTALAVAASARRWEVIPLLLAAKANPNPPKSAGYTPLMLAVQDGRLDMVQALLAAGADPSPKVSAGGGRSALVWALMARNLEIALALVKAGADGNMATDYSETPLRLAAGGSTPAHLELVRALLAKGADVEAGQLSLRNTRAPCDPPDPGEDCWIPRRTAEGTALGIAAASGSVEIVSALLAARANVEGRQRGWRTPLMIAALAGRADVARLLLAAGADVAARDSSDRTALMLATSVQPITDADPTSFFVVAAGSPSSGVATRVSAAARQEVMDVLQAAAGVAAPVKN
jgi:ankyrin repeat protein